MLLHKAMKYYRLWIYTCNVVLLLGVVVFVVTATVLLSDLRFRFVPITMYHPTFLYAYLALMAQGGLLQAIGCYGALRLNEKWINLYWFAMLFLLVGDLLVGVIWMFLFNGLAHSLPTVLWTRIREDYGSDVQLTHDWNRLQEEFGCCGVHGPRDFNGTPWALLLPFAATGQSIADSSTTSNDYYNNNESLFVPNSCCLSVDYYILSDDSSFGVAELLQSNSSSSGSTLGSDHPANTNSDNVNDPLERPYAVSCDIIQQSSATATSSSSSSQARLLRHHHRLHEHDNDHNIHSVGVHGCARVVLDWMQHCADVLLVLGYCVIAFLKLCFLGILRYEIKEMIQKIKVLQSDVPDFCELMSDGVTAVATAAVIADSKAPNNLSSSLATDRLLVTVSIDRKTAQLRCGSNGNNNELELMELTRNGT